MRVVTIRLVGARTAVGLAKRMFVSGATSQPEVSPKATRMCRHQNPLRLRQQRDTQRSSNDAVPASRVLRLVFDERPRYGEPAGRGDRCSVHQRPVAAAHVLDLDVVAAAPDLGMPARHAVMVTGNEEGALVEIVLTAAQREED